MEEAELHIKISTANGSANEKMQEVVRELLKLSRSWDSSPLVQAELEKADDTQ